MSVDRSGGDSGGSGPDGAGLTPPQRARISNARSMSQARHDDVTSKEPKDLEALGEKSADAEPRDQQQFSSARSYFTIMFN